MTTSQNSQKPDYSHWLTKAQAAEAIGVSTKTVEKLAQEKQLQQATWRRPGRPAVVVYHPDDVARVRKERQPDAEPFVLPAAPETPASTALTVRNGSAAPELAALLSALTRPAPAVRVAERLFLTIPEASDYSGLPIAHLRRLIKDGKLPGMKTGSGWRIRRTDLEVL